MKLIITSMLLVALVAVSGSTNKERVVRCHHEAFAKQGVTGYGWRGWSIYILQGGKWQEIGADTSSEDTAWFTALEWCIAYDCCK